MMASVETHPDFETEQAFLQHAARCLAKMTTAAKSPPGAGSVKASAALKRMQDEFLKEVSRESTITIGRIDQVDGDRFHIGPRIVWDGINPIVISWAAPIAAPFYTATPADAQGLILRRRLRTEYDRLLGIQDDFFDTSRVGAIAATDTADKTAQIEPAISDALLDELRRKRTGELHEIAATIQRDQYEVITRAADISTIVQGAPGTGKTLVGLHRAALLLFRNRSQGFEPKVLIVGPNPLFIRYISYVLPSLNETAVDQLAASELGPIPTRLADDPAVARVKGSPMMVRVIANALTDRVRVPTEATGFRPSGLTFEVDASAIAEAVEAVRAESLPYNAMRERFRLSLEDLVTQAFLRARDRSGRSIETTLRQLPEFARAMDRIWPFMTPIELTRQLLTSEERLEKASSGILSDAERRLLYRKPELQGAPVPWTTSDVPLLDEAQSLIEGSTPRYWHVVLDEAQDLTPMELRMVGRRVTATAITVLGDLAQATGGWKYEHWVEILNHLGIAPDSAIQELRYAYRVPTEIMKLARPILKLTAPTVANPISVRRGGAVVWIHVDSGDRSSRAVIAAIDASRAGGTTAIVAPRGELPNLRRELESRSVQYGDAELSEVLDSQIELVDPVMAKGLEFDHVVLIEPGALIRDAASGQGYRELYVALTRATQSLALVYSDALPWPLIDMVGVSSPAREETSDGPASATIDHELDRARIAAEMMRNGLSAAEAREYALLVYPDIDGLKELLD
jgi:DNA helicase IV